LVCKFHDVQIKGGDTIEIWSMVDFKIIILIRKIVLLMKIKQTDCYLWIVKFKHISNQQALQNITDYFVCELLIYFFVTGITSFKNTFVILNKIHYWIICNKVYKRLALNNTLSHI
jgi:hypothetical protein